MCQPPWKQYTDMVKDYYGEKIGLYFVWLGGLVGGWVAGWLGAWLIYLSID